MQTKDKASDALNIGAGTLISKGSGYNAYLLMVVRNSDGAIVCVRIASSEAYSMEQGRSAYLSPEDLFLALQDDLPEALSNFAN